MVLGLSRRSIGAVIICFIAPLLFAVRAFPETFKNPLILPTSTDPLAIATGDLNHDGKPDLVYMDGQRYGQESLHVLLGDGTGKFTHEQDVSLPGGLCCVITIADVNGDAIPDVILQGGQQTVVMVGNGNGTFQAPVVSTFQSAVGSVRGAIGVGDINGDGYVDLVVPDATNNDLDLLLGDGTGKFTLLSTILTYTYDAVYLADLNGDGNLDIIATDHIGATFLVYLGNGNGTFQNLVRYTGQPGTDALILTDVDGDGHPDMLTQYYPDQIGYFKGNSDGTFGALTSIPSATAADPLVAVGDFNSDGVPDLLFLTATGIGTKLDTANLSYSAMQLTVSGRTPPPPATPLPPVAADFNSDGHLDVAVPVEGGIAILFGNGDGTFASVDFYDMGQEVGGAAVADFNGDGNPDIAVTLPATFPRLLLGDGTGNFTLGPDPNTSYSASGADVTAVAADFNGDGKKDLDIGNIVANAAIGTGTGTQSIAFGNGDGTFATPVAIVDSSPIAADVNGDGRSDMIFINGTSLIASLGEANDSFTDITTPLRDATASFLFNVGDVNNDGKPDVVINYGDHLEVWTGNGDGSFSYLASTGIQGMSSDVVAAVADLDGDGNGDIVLGPSFYSEAPSGPLAIFYGNGDGTFQPPVFLPIAHCYSQVTVADVNGDNKPDLIMTDGAGIAVMMNLGGRKFDSEVDYVGGTSISALSVADVNGDGFPDIVAANTGGTTVTVLLNEPNGTSLAGSFVDGTISISPAAPISGQPISFALAVSGQTAGAAVPTGTVSFYIDGGFQADVPLTNGTATYNFTGTLIPIQHTLVATYNGDSVYAARSFSSVFTVQPPTYSTTTTLAATPTTLLASQTVRLVATVSSAVAVPSGRVTFLDGGQSIGSAVIDSQGVAYLDTALLGAGVHSLSAKFDGFTQIGFTGTSVSYIAAIFSPSTSSAVSVTVNVNATATSLSGSATSLTAGNVETFTANVNSSGGTPFGGVSFYDGTTLLGTMALDANATAGFSTASLSAGTHSIVASFNANGPFAGSSSAPLSVTVAPAAATLAAVVVSLDPETNTADGGSTLVATLSALSGLPRGIVTFLDDGRVLGKAVTDASERASLAIGTPASGIHELRASFAGAPGFAPAVSPVVQDRWPATGPGFGLAVGSDVVRLSASAPASLQVRVAPLAGYAQPVQLSCAAGLPAGYACSFTPGMLNGGASILTISPAGWATATPPAGMPWYWPAIGLFLLGGLAGLLWPGLGIMGRPMRLRKAVLLLVVCCAFGALTGCAANVSSPRETILTIQAKSGTAAATIVHSTQVTLRFH